MQPPLERMRDDLVLRNYSTRTQKIYSQQMRSLERRLGRPAESLDSDELRRYLLDAIQGRQCSWSWWKCAVAAMRFFYGTTLGREDVVPQLPFPRREVSLPEVLSVSEVEMLLSAVRPLKYRLLLMTLYSGGLRLSEGIGLTPSCLDTYRMVIHVRHGKGRKDRIVPLSPVLLENAREYWRREGMGRWLFPGNDPSKPVSSERVQAVMRSARQEAGIHKRATPRTLRHSFATHLLEAGADILVIQKLLGHASLQSTLVYTHVTIRHIESVRSPLDSLRVGFASDQLSLAGM